MADAEPGTAGAAVCLEVAADGAGQRADRYVTDRAGLPSRTQLHQRLARMTINGRAAKPSARLAAGDRVEVTLMPPPAAGMLPEPLPLQVLYEDDAVVVLNKPSGLVVHPGSGNRSGTLVNGLLHRYPDLAERFPGSPRPGIVHRLDKDTSGVIIAARQAAAHAHLARQFSERRVAKLYYAWVAGRPIPAAGQITTGLRRDPRNPLRMRASRDQGKAAVTRYQVRETRAGASLVELRPVTGRTHQLRVHLRWLGHPILGDPLYAGRARGSAPRLLLHARRLVILLPEEAQPRAFTAPLPPGFAPPEAIPETRTEGYLRENDTDGADA